MANDGRQIADLRSGDAELLTGPPSVDPEVGRVKLWATNDPFNGITLHFKMKGASAWLTDQNDVLAILARDAGADGNGLSVELRRGPENSPLEVRYNRVARSLLVILAASGDAVKATATTTDEDPPFAGDHDLVFTAKEAGAEPNGLNVYYDDIIDAGRVSTTVEVDDGTIVVHLKQAAVTYATAHDTVNKILFTSKTPGSAGNGPAAGVSVFAGATGQDPPRYEQLGGGATTADAVVHLDADGATVTRQGLIDFVNADSGAAFTAALDAGQSGSTLVANSPSNPNTPRPFAGGGGGNVTATAAQVKAAIEASSPAHALIDVAFAKSGGTGAGVIAQHDVSVALEGGVDADTITTQAPDVVAAMAAIPTVDADFAALAIGEGPVSAIPLTNLHDGDSEGVYTAQLYSD